MEITTKYGQEIDWNCVCNNMMGKYGKMERYENLSDYRKKAFTDRELLSKYWCGFSYLT
jgi:hypothetical protein